MSALSELQRHLKQSLVACFLFACAGFCSAATFTIMGTPTQPFKSSTSEGISIELISMALREMGIVDYKFVLVDSVQRAVREAKEGRVEMLIGYSKKLDRLAYLAYPEVSYRHIKWHFFIRKADQGKIRFETFEDLKGLRIGVTEGVSYTPEFWAAERFLKFDRISMNDLQIKKLLLSRVDVVPLNTRSTLYEARILGIEDKITYLPKAFKDKPYYDPICINSDYFEPKKGDYLSREEKIRAVLNSYDMAMQKLINDGTVEQVYQKYGLKFNL